MVYHVGGRWVSTAEFTVMFSTAAPAPQHVAHPALSRGGRGETNVGVGNVMYASTAAAGIGAAPSGPPPTGGGGAGLWANSAEPPHWGGPAAPAGGPGAAHWSSPTPSFLPAAGSGGSGGIGQSMAEIGASADNLRRRQHQHQHSAQLHPHQQHPYQDPHQQHQQLHSAPAHTPPPPQHHQHHHQSPPPPPQQHHQRGEQQSTVMYAKSLPSSGPTPLGEASERGDVPAVNTMLRGGHDPDAPGMA